MMAWRGEFCVKKEFRLAEIANPSPIFLEDDHNNDKHQQRQASTTTSQFNGEHHDSIDDRSSPTVPISSISAALMRVERTLAEFRDVQNAGHAAHHQAND
jgi:hypothetical protein